MVSRKTPLKALKSAVLPAAVLALSLALMAGNTNPGYAATDVPKWKPGQTFKDCPECPELVVIPAGIFIMGLNGKSKKNKPAHRVNINKPFALGRYEVTWAEWQACKDAKGCISGGDHDHSWGKKGRPVINVAFVDAKQYLGWISNKTGKRSAATTQIARTAKASGATAARFRTGRPPWDHSSPIPSGFMTPPPTCSNGSKTAGTPPIEGRLPTAPPGRKATAATGSSGAGLFIITPRWGGRPTGPRTRPGSKATGSVSESSGNWIRALWRPSYLTARARARWLRASWRILLSICVKLRATSRHMRWRLFNSSPLSLSSPS